MDDDLDLLAAIGEVTVEAGKLEYAAARLVVGLREPAPDDPVTAVAELMKPGRLRKALRQTVEDHGDWGRLRMFFRNYCAVIDDRHVLVHSVAIQVTDNHSAAESLEFWHVPSNTRATIEAAAVREHAGEIGRCFSEAVALVRIAELPPGTKFGPGMVPIESDEAPGD